MAKTKNEPCCEKFKTMIGGQALIEGIMMRGPEKDAIVVRTKDGLQVDVKPRKVHKKGSFATWPVIRGAVGFFDSQVTGVKALMQSADLAPEEMQEEPSKFDKWLEEKLGNEYVMLFRMHHLTTAMLGIEYNDFARDCSHVPSINELMIIADVLLSDYSATIFDFSILEKPMISFAYDYEGYAESRGFYENINDVLLGCVFDTEDKIIKHILDMDYEAECLKTKDVKNKYMEADGNATKVCMDYLLQYKN